MMIPNADEAVIAKDKLCDYLWNPIHRRGASKEGEGQVHFTSYMDLSRFGLPLLAFCNH